MPSVRRFLTMRAAVERDVRPEDGVDEGDSLTFDGFSFGGSSDPGNPAAPTSIASAMPCFVWGNTEKTLFDDDKTVSISDYTMAVEYAADIRELDEITTVRVRGGGTFLSGGRMRVLKVIPRRGWGPQRLRFKEIMLETTGPVAEDTGATPVAAVTPGDLFWGESPLRWGDSAIGWGGS